MIEIMISFVPTVVAICEMGQKTPEEKLREAVNWLNARLKAHADKGEYAIFIGGLGI